MQMSRRPNRLEDFATGVREWFRKFKIFYRLGLVRLGWVRLGQVRLGSNRMVQEIKDILQIRLGYVTSARFGLSG
jgi:hypothetical protein